MGGRFSKTTLPANFTIYWKRCPASCVCRIWNIARTLRACLKTKRGCVEYQSQHAATNPEPLKVATRCGWSRTTQPRSGIFRQALRSGVPSVAMTDSRNYSNLKFRFALCSRTAEITTASSVFVPAISFMRDATYFSRSRFNSPIFACISARSLDLVSI